MKNWAGSFEFSPAHVFSPKSETELVQIVSDAHQKNHTLRAKGSAHSWTPLIATNDWFISFDQLSGITEVQKEQKTVSALAGTKLKTFTHDCFKHDLALPNQGDIEAQSLAGALSTGTHGTGATLQSLSNQIQKARVVLADGSIKTVDQKTDPDFFNAFRVSLGAFGLMSQLKIKMIDSYKLKMNSWPESMDATLEKLDQLIAENRHFELFYFPIGDWSIVKTMNITNDPVIEPTVFTKLNEVVLNNWFYELINIIAQKTNRFDSFDRLMKKVVSPEKAIHWSHQVFPSIRTVKFMEMEFNVPRDQFRVVFSELKATIKKLGFKTLFPIEIRFVKSDDIWISPAYQRESVYFAVHTYIDQDYREYFLALQSVFKKYGGRPHYGKWHSYERRDFEQVYPRWNDFCEMRQKIDPQGRWLNPHLRALFT